MKWWKVITASGMGMLFLALGESIRECRSFRMTHYDLRLSGECEEGQESRIVFLSDLHNQVYGRKNDTLLDEIRKVEPELILIGGDMLIGKKNARPDAALEFIRQLPDIAPVYYALGNHEQRMKSRIEKYGNMIYYYMKELMAAGVHFLENESVELSLNSREVRITGLALPLDSYEKIKSASVSRRDIERLVGEADKTYYQILLSHNPVYVPVYKEWGLMWCCAAIYTAESCGYQDGEALSRLRRLYFRSIPGK